MIILFGIAYAMLLGVGTAAFLFFGLFIMEWIARWLDILYGVIVGDKRVLNEFRCDKPRRFWDDGPF